MPVTVVTAAANQYETTLMSEMEKSEAPTLFQVNGPVGLANWKDYCLDLSDSKLYGELTSDSFALKDGDAIPAIAYVIETYGIIYNKELLTAAGYTQDDITSFDSLKAVADDIQARKDELGIQGAFTSAGMDSSSDWRYKTHLANCPSTTSTRPTASLHTDAIKGTYLDKLQADLRSVHHRFHPATPPSWPARPATTPSLSSSTSRPSFTRTAPGPTPTSKTWATTTSA